MRHPKELALIEREMMLLSRHQVLATTRTSGGADSQERLERSAYTLLSRIETEGPLTIGQLAEAFGLDTSTVNRQTAAMLRAGLVDRIPDPDGGVARKLRITDEGMRRLHHDREWSIQGLAKVVGDWTTEDLAEFADILERFNRDIEKLQGRPWPRA
ncbi:MarR family winged helix-turn-helix transcriptional regulator [Kitasatospora cheerisanensis]|uniref:Transcriptional regulator n=1 Tax=Kitasatospora cheerisanensis KCTC 2395 TaxID=1348663 RepID=A0A066YZ54_9ACTN|nr:MarR family transcriptional regulator [Kitasatospora cheerisanensis]KDN86532.1 transcriptional regulator [Kitasatospora cheerisanensis KCTC 2395]